MFKPRVNSRALPCRHCGQLFFPASLNFHMPVCEKKQAMVMVPCPGCDAECRKKDLDAHMASCPSAKAMMLAPRAQHSTLTGNKRTSVQWEKALYVILKSCKRIAADRVSYAMERETNVRAIAKLREQGIDDADLRQVSRNRMDHLICRKKLYKLQKRAFLILNNSVFAVAKKSPHVDFFKPLQVLEETDAMIVDSESRYSLALKKLSSFLDDHPGAGASHGGASGEDPWAEARALVSQSIGHNTEITSGSGGQRNDYGIIASDGRLRCPVCNRRFVADRLGAHQTICRRLAAKARRKPRGVFRSSEKRLAGLVAQGASVGGKKSLQVSTVATSNTSSKGKDGHWHTNWRQKHEEMQQVIQAVKAGKGLSSEGGVGNHLSHRRRSFEPEPYLPSGSPSALHRRSKKPSTQSHRNQLLKQQQREQRHEKERKEGFSTSLHESPQTVSKELSSSSLRCPNNGLQDIIAKEAEHCSWAGRSSVVDQRQIPAKSTKPESSAAEETADQSLKGPPLPSRTEFVPTPTQLRGEYGYRGNGSVLQDTDDTAVIIGAAGRREHSKHGDQEDCDGYEIFNWDGGTAAALQDNGCGGVLDFANVSVPTATTAMLPPPQPPSPPRNIHRMKDSLHPQQLSPLMKEQQQLRRQQEGAQESDEYRLRNMSQTPSMQESERCPYCRKIMPAANIQLHCLRCPSAPNGRNTQPQTSANSGGSRTQNCKPAPNTASSSAATPTTSGARRLGTAPKVASTTVPYQHVAAKVPSWKPNAPWGSSSSSPMSDAHRRRQTYKAAAEKQRNRNSSPSKVPSSSHIPLPPKPPKVSEQQQQRRRKQEPQQVQHNPTQAANAQKTSRQRSGGTTESSADLPSFMRPTASARSKRRFS